MDKTCEMVNLLHIAICRAHRVYKFVRNIGGDSEAKANFCDAPLLEFTIIHHKASSGTKDQAAFSGYRIEDFYPVENVCSEAVGALLPKSFVRKRWFATAEFGVHEMDERQACDLWGSFIDRAEIPEPYKNNGLFYGGFIGSSVQSWCLPSWIWTNGAIIRYFLATGQLQRGQTLGEKLLLRQEESGGWVVRDEYFNGEAVGIIAPNDSSYLANNGMLELYKRTGDGRFLKSAERCAEWIMTTKRKDGLVWTGYRLDTNEWMTKHTIVDTAFTLALFANLYVETGKKAYLGFAKNFATEFVAKFYDFDKGLFHTTLNDDGSPSGGYFARGQAWALEGLIAFYKATGDVQIKEIIERNIETICSMQLKNGGWSYNLTRPWYGEDCKGVSVIASAIQSWDSSLYSPVISKALAWCKKHTARGGGDSRGGIFSFTLEGAIAHNRYSQTAFVYASAYAVELLKYRNGTDCNTDERT